MIGLIAGSGKLPLIFSKNAKKNGEKILVIALIDEADKKIQRYADKLFWERPGNLTNIIKILKREKIQRVSMLGKVHKINLFSSFMPDLKTLKILMTLKDKKDITILKRVIWEIEKNGIRVMPVTFYLENCLSKRGSLTKRKPNKKELRDINFGFPIAKRLANMDIGQTIVVKDRIILAVEGIEGTDETIKRGGILGRKNAVCIKVARSKQDLRMDIPAIGIDTIKTLVRFKVNCLAIESNKMLIVEKEKLIKLAERSNICVVSV